MVTAREPTDTGKMRALTELLSSNPALPVLQSWVSAASRSVKVLPADRSRSEAVLVALQVTTRSPMGALALETGGFVIDGLLRILGGAGPGMTGDLARWNGMGNQPLLPARDGALLVGHDAIGGFFALDGGGLGDGKGKVFYFAPDFCMGEPRPRLLGMAGSDDERHPSEVLRGEPVARREPRSRRLRWTKASRSPRRSGLRRAVQSRARLAEPFRS